MQFLYKVFIFLSLLGLTVANRAFPSWENLQWVDTLSYEGTGVQEKTLNIEIPLNHTLVFQIPNDCRIHIKSLQLITNDSNVPLRLVWAKSQTQHSYWIYDSSLDSDIKDELLLTLWSYYYYEQEQCQIRLFHTI